MYASLLPHTLVILPPSLFPLLALPPLSLLSLSLALSLPFSLLERGEVTNSASATRFIVAYRKALDAKTMQYCNNKIIN